MHLPNLTSSSQNSLNNVTCINELAVYDYIKEEDKACSSWLHTHLSDPTTNKLYNIANKVTFGGKSVTL